MVNVIPKNDTIRKLIKHPVAGAFRSEGSSNWPDDTFTHRRLADGDITLEEVKKEEPQHHKEEPQHKEDEHDKAASSKRR
jgi:hypothetical protein